MPPVRILPAALLAVVLASAAAAWAEPGLSDPAAALCVKNGATVTMETAPNGSRHGVCVFPNGSRIEAGAYFRNKHRGH